MFQHNESVAVRSGTVHITFRSGHLLRAVERMEEADPISKSIGNNIPIHSERLDEDDIRIPGHQRDLGILAKLAQRLRLR